MAQKSAWQTRFTAVDGFRTLDVWGSDTIVVAQETPAFKVYTYQSLRGTLDPTHGYENFCFTNVSAHDPTS